jgi:cation transport regulator ChaB
MWRAWLTRTPASADEHTPARPARGCDVAQTVQPAAWRAADRRRRSVGGRGGGGRVGPAPTVRRFPLRTTSPTPSHTLNRLATAPAMDAPIRCLDELPARVRRHLPPDAQSTYKNAYNAAYVNVHALSPAARPDSPHVAAACHRRAWLAVEAAYEHVSEPPPAPSSAGGVECAPGGAAPTADRRGRPEQRGTSWVRRYASSAEKAGDLPPLTASGGGV